MKVLVATRKTQKERASDFCFTREGELVVRGFECDSDDSIDGRCGCLRSMCGVKTGKATTTFMVAEQPITMEDLTKSFAKELVEGGWYKTTQAASSRARISAVSLTAVAKKYKAGTVLERRGNRILARTGGKAKKSR